jgi:hypothetical protein
MQKKKNWTHEGPQVKKEGEEKERKEKIYIEHMKAHKKQRKQ